MTGELEAGSLLGKRYRLTRRLGEGSMGIVWAAINEETSGEVAIKVILKSNEKLKKRLQREGRACIALRHPNLIEVYDSDTTEDGDPFLVMQLLSGETLRDRLNREGRLVPDEA